MENEGNITAAGLLYEGNYDAWVEQMNLMLRRLHDGVYIQDDSVHIPSGFSKNRDLSALLRASIAPHLLARISGINRIGVKRLFGRLKALAVPFTFLDLPAELRRRVYQYAMPAELAVQINARDGTKKHGSPPIVRVSRTIREEALPVFFMQTTLKLLFLVKEPHMHTVQSLNIRNLNVADIVQELAENYLGDYCRYLRSVTIDTDSFERPKVSLYPTFLEFTCSPERGLEIRYNENDLDQATKDAIDKHATAMEETRKLHGLQGEAIIKAIVSSPKLWKYRYLHYWILR